MVVDKEKIILQDAVRKAVSSALKHASREPTITRPAISTQQ